MQRFLHAFLLAFAFLLAQAGMVAHAASHLTQIERDGGSGLPSGEACELCAGYAQLGGGTLVSAEATLAACVTRHAAPLTAFSFDAARVVLGSRARAPPTFS